MKNSLAFCFLILTCAFSYAQNKCEKFKTGEFVNTENGIVKLVFSATIPFKQNNSMEKR